jgi:hypothetical protein
MKVSKFISQIKSNNKFLFDDNIISDRTIYQTGVSILLTLIKQEVNRKKLLNSDNIFVTIECLDLKETTYTECSLPCAGTIRRSVDKLPKLQEGINGYIIQGVYNIDNSEEIFPTTHREVINESKLRFKSNKLKYLIKDEYIYVLNPDIENINVYLFSADDSYNLTECQSMYEAELKVPGYLEKSLFDLTNQELINYFKYKQDITDNNLEE